MAKDREGLALVWHCIKDPESKERLSSYKIRDEDGVVCTTTEAHQDMRVMIRLDETALKEIMFRMI